MKIQLTEYIDDKESRILNNNDEFGHLPEFDPFTLQTKDYVPMRNDLEFKSYAQDPTPIKTNKIADPLEFQELSLKNQTIVIQIKEKGGLE